jgi:phospholipid/cholesterol/gamma-HCH transport system permease protein
VNPRHTAKSQNDANLPEAGLIAGWLGRLGRAVLVGARHVGRAGILAAATFVSVLKPAEYRREAFVQAKKIGIDSLPLVLLVAALSGSILAQQSGYQFTEIPLWVVGNTVAAGMLTELAPLLSAIIMAGRVGSGIGAELGTMKVTNQIDALRTLGRDPVTELVAPRVVAGAIMMLPIVIFANIVGIWSGWLSAIALLPVGFLVLVQRSGLNPSDLVASASPSDDVRRGTAGIQMGATHGPAGRTGTGL